MNLHAATFYIILYKGLGKFLYLQDHVFLFDCYDATGRDVE